MRSDCRGGGRGGEWVPHTAGWGPNREVDRRNGELSAPRGPDLSLDLMPQKCQVLGCIFLERKVKPQL